MIDKNKLSWLAGELQSRALALQHYIETDNCLMQLQANDCETAAKILVSEMEFYFHAIAVDEPEYPKPPQETDS